MEPSLKLSVAYSKRDLEEVFPRPAIREVAFEIRFAPRFRVQAEIWRLQDQLVEQYPEANTEAALQPNGSRLDVNVFQNSREGRVIKVSQQNFAIAFSRYKNFEGFKEEVSLRTFQFCESFGVSNLTRVGLRYVNQIVLPSNDATALLRYVNPVLDFSRIPIERTEHLATKAVFRYKNHYVTLQTVLLPGEQKVYVLDIDCHVESSLNASECNQLLDDFHESAQHLFLDHITEEFKQLMRGKA